MLKQETFDIIFDCYNNSDFELSPRRNLRGNFGTKPIPEIEAFVRSLGIPIKHLKRHPYYNRSRDIVVMPPISSFSTVQHYYATLFHEITHATMHKTRLNRKTSYHIEEVTATFGSGHLLQRFGLLEGMGPRLANYIGHYAQQGYVQNAMHRGADHSVRAYKYLVK